MFFKKWVGGENYFLSLYNIQHVRQGKGKVEPCGGGILWVIPAKRDLPRLATALASVWSQ